MSSESSHSMRRLIEAYFERSTGKTFIRHPRSEGEWVECSILSVILKGEPVTSVSGTETCELFKVVPADHDGVRSKPQHVRLKITMAGRCGKDRNGV